EPLNSNPFAALKLPGLPGTSTSVDDPAATYQTLTSSLVRAFGSAVTHALAVHWTTREQSTDALTSELCASATPAPTKNTNSDASSPQIAISARRIGRVFEPLSDIPAPFATPPEAHPWRRFAKKVGFALAPQRTKATNLKTPAGSSHPS